MPNRVAAAALIMAGLAFPACSSAAGTLAGFAPQFPEAFVPAGGYGVPILVRAQSDSGYWAGPGQPVRIAVSCGHFEGFGSEMWTATGNEGWVSTEYAYRAPLEAQECEMAFFEVDGDASLSVPLHVYDPATAVMAPDLAEGIVTDAARPFQLKLDFFTASGQAIANNPVVAMVSKVQGASAEVDFLASTDIDGTRYVNGLGNNAVGSYELIIELHGGKRWSIPVQQQPPLPGSRRHFGSM